MMTRRLGSGRDRETIRRFDDSTTRRDVNVYFYPARARARATVSTPPTARGTTKEAPKRRSARDRVFSRDDRRAERRVPRARVVGRVIARENTPRGDMCPEKDGR